jgi:hypothetical protein
VVNEARFNCFEHLVKNKVNEKKGRKLCEEKEKRGRRRRGRRERRRERRRRRRERRRRRRRRGCGLRTSFALSASFCDWRI